jgi:hypothetical protein
MKRVFAAITLVIYIAVSSGIVINFHYCMDELASVQLYETQTSICGKCGMAKKSFGCCRDEITVIKITDDQQTSAAPASVQAPVFELTIPSLLTEELEVGKTTINDWQNHSPPLLPGEPIYLANRNFRI